MAAQAGKAKKKPVRRGRSKATPAKGPKAARRQAKRRSRLRLVSGIVAATLTATLAASAGAFVWDRWFRFDDAADIQGQWSAASGAAGVVIDEGSIRLTGDVAYGYTLDTWEKTLTFTFGALRGQGSYRFSDDRQTLEIVEGAAPDLWGDLQRKLGIFPVPDPNTAALPTTVFTKVPPPAPPVPPDPAGGEAAGVAGGEAAGTGGEAGAAGGAGGEAA